MSCPPHPPWLAHSNYTWRSVQKIITFGFKHFSLPLLVLLTVLKGLLKHAKQDSSFKRSILFQHELSISHAYLCFSYLPITKWNIGQIFSDGHNSGFIVAYFRTNQWLALSRNDATGLYRYGQ
jgi:hypothetical protein